MAKLGDLIVRIGADTRDLNKKLGKVQRNMRSMTSNFKKLGTQMTQAVTLPLLAIGAIAVKSAADLEKMETSFISLTGGAAQAADMMKQLNEFTAKTPFQIDAIATSARQLIASGTGIAEVNNQLQFLGDIAATTGQPINEIAAIFAKVNAKGKVELENLNQLAERGIPVFKGLAKATGLLPSELGAGAVTVQQFNDYLKSLSEEGGFAAGAMERFSQTVSGKFSTALDNLKLAGAELAESLMPTINELLDGIVSLAQKFVGLSDSTKKSILTFGGLVAAIGPLLIILPTLISGVSKLGEALGAAAGPVGWVSLAVTALTAGIVALEIANHNALSSVQKAEKATRKQSTEVRYLVEQYKDETKSLKDRERILKRLQEIDSTHFSNLSAENTKYGDLVKNLDAYTSSLRRNYLEKAMAEEGAQLMRDLMEAEELINERRIRLQEQYDRNAVEVAILKAEGWLEAAKRGQVSALKNLEDFEKQKQKMLEKYAAPGTVINSDGGSEGNSDGGSEGLIVVSDYNSGVLELLSNLDHMATKTIPELAGQLGQLFNVENSTALLSYLEDFEALGAGMSKVANEITETVKTAFGEMADFINKAISAAVSDMVIGTAAMIGTAIALGKPIKDLGNILGGVIANLATQLGEYAITHGIAILAIRESLKTLNPYLVIAAGVALVALGAGMKSNIQRQTDIPALADGGLAFGPTLAMVGDNKNASADPEVIAPLSKLKDMLGGGSIQVYGRISGDDIVLSNSRASRDRNRF